MAEKEEKERGREAQAPAIIQIDPFVAEQSLFNKLAQQVVEDEKIDQVLERLQSLRAGPEEIAGIVHVVMKQYTGTLLGQIIPPHAGSRLVKDRIVQIAVVILEMLRERVRQAELEISQAIAEGREYEVEDKVRELVRMHQAALIAIREIMNRYIVLYYTNLPPNMRPPLAQIKLGIEIVK